MAMIIVPPLSKKTKDLTKYNQSFLHGCKELYKTNHLKVKLVKIHLLILLLLFSHAPHHGHSV